MTDEMLALTGKKNKIKIHAKLYKSATPHSIHTPHHENMPL